MSNPTLYLIQSNFNNTDAMINSLLQLYTHNDAVVFMGEAVLFIEDERLQHLKNIYALENDAEILSHAPPSSIQLITYAEFADLVVNFTRSIRLK
ncbi:DsrH/TusB family sulfur metabolism protein [Acinetobacter sp. ANC 3832]|uniref:DsrH/TusB family sulfur metabolism protein n=1 Tax=Acinetobacter sp. ANC 3832 TaxID=1977874 RepID=UPI000A334893|nr:DsrH/TusB family sulfur metabolism protein [Acinetobacter sp. ANC 3832]OTG92369.1 hypothetical protein B9T35_13630 [Acinetobacter sp. ANC 3832]